MLTSKLSASQRSYLDFIRATGAMLVLLGHSTHFFLGSSHLADQAQGFGVLLFFLISGFLISYSVLRRNDGDDYGFSHYFIDRFCRIYCAYLPALFLVLVLDSIVVSNPLYAWKSDYNPQTWFANLFMLQDFPVFQVLRRLGAHDHTWFVREFGTARPFWTISVEWWIYMTFGMIMLVWRRRHWRLGAVGAIVLAFVAIEPAYYFVGGFDECLTLLWLLGLAASVLLLSLPRLTAAWKRSDVARWHHLCLLAAGVGVLAMGARLLANHFAVAEFQFGLFLAVTLFALFFALGAWPNAVPSWMERAIGFFAGYSYSLYLTHYTLLSFIDVTFPGHQHDPRFFWLAIGVANALAITFWWLFERHHRHIAAAAKAWLSTRQRGPAAETPQPVSTYGLGEVHRRHGPSGVAVPSSR